MANEPQGAGESLPPILGVNRRNALLDLASSVLLGLGLVSLAIPLFGYWLIHGDYDRYIWLINGPSPFDRFGGGPFQLFMGLGFLAVGLGAIVAGIALRLAPHVPELAAGLGLAASVSAFLGGFVLVVTLLG